jgi:dienelactone hydrolase
MSKASWRLMFGAVAVSVGAFAVGSLRIVSEQASTVSARALVIAPTVMPLGLPDAKAAKAVLSASLLHHHPQWIDVPMGTSLIRTFVIYPDLSGKLPVAVVTDQNQAMSDWARAVGTQVVDQGFITVVPDLSGPGANEIERRMRAVRDYFVSQPGSNGDSVAISFNWGEGRIDAAISTLTQHRVVQFDVTEHAWHNTLALLTNMAPRSATAPQGDTGGGPKDDLAKALGSRSAADRMQLVRTAREYGLKLPRANGKSGVTGFCNGGGMAWESTAAIAGFNAAVSFYGAPPEAATMAKIQAPVLAFAGDDDPGLAPRVSGAAPDMQRLGKTFEFKIYPNVTHAYLHQQTLGENAVATLDSWTKAMAFFKRYLS